MRIMSFSNRSNNLIEIVVLTLSLLIGLNEAGILNEPINLPIGYYVESNDDSLRNSYYGTQLINDYDPILNSIPTQRRDVSPSAALAASEGLEYLVDQTSSSSSPSSNQAPELGTLDARKLINFLNQLKQEDFVTDTINDVNLHLPASEIIEDNSDNVVSDPVNDPIEFEATLSYLTNTLNHEIPNSSNRSTMLDTLMPVYLGTIIKQMQQQQQRQQKNQKDDQVSKQQEDKDEQPKQYLLGRVLTSDNSDDLEISDQDRNSNNNGNYEQRNDASISSSSSAPTPASRYGGSEYIDHPLALVGHQYMQGGAGEGKQLLGPDGTFENVQVIKTDHAVPSYCDPPNPCPLGFTSEDGCLENFVNSASFSREFQAKQQCSCDNEHSLFNCASPVSTMKNQIYSSDTNHQGENDSGNELNEFMSPTSPSSSSSSLPSDLNIIEQQNNKLDTLARTIQNRFGGLESVRNMIEKHEEEMFNNDQSVHLSRVAKKAPRNEANFRY